MPELEGLLSVRVRLTSLAPPFSSSRCTLSSEQLPVWTTLPESMMELPADRVPHHSLDDFERLN
jgi:hypothetical protein